MISSKRSKMKSDLDCISIGKYILIAVIILFVAWVLSNSGGGDQPFSLVSESMEQTVDVQALQKAEDQALKRYYKLNPADYDNVMLYTATYNMSAEEMLLIKVKDTSQLQDIEDAISQRIENRRNDFENYLPEQVALLDNAVMEIRGNYVFFVISSNAEKYRSIFMKNM